MNGPVFVEPPAWMFRRRPRFDPGLLPLAGAILAAAFLALLIAMLEAGLGVRLGDLIAR